VYVTKLRRRNYVHGGVKVNDKRSIEAVISQLESSTDTIRNAIREVHDEDAMTELTHALLLVDDGTKRCRAALSDLERSI
jgi:hypothetical protein